MRLDSFSHLLKRMESASLNAVKGWKHLKPPMWKEKVLCISFKTEAIGDVQQWHHFPRVTGKRVIFAQNHRG